MNTNNIKRGLVFSVLLLIFLSPQTASAYKTVDQKAVKINDSSILYTITYRFGFMNRSVYMPIGALRGVENASSSPYIGYDILNQGELVQTGNSGALVFSNAPVKDNQYFLSEGKGADFTLVTILNLPKAISNNDALSLKVNHLPFVMVDGEESSRTFLHKRELEPYMTPIVSDKYIVSVKIK